jgi:hypothetical protein
VWKGEWKYDDPLWNQKLREEVEYLNNKDNGVFMIELNTFV